MVNDVLAVGVALAVALVLATILGGAELAGRLFRAVRRAGPADPPA